MALPLAPAAANSPVRPPKSPAFSGAGRRARRGGSGQQSKTALFPIKQSDKGKNAIELPWDEAEPDDRDEDFGNIRRLCQLRSALLVASFSDLHSN